MLGLSILAQKLLSRIPTYSYLSDGKEQKKQPKADPTYHHISNHYFEKEDPETKVVSVHRIGITYRKPKEENKNA